jgi:hypothetical protein
MESLERLVLHHQVCNRDRLGNSRKGNFSPPFAYDFVPGHATFQLVQNDPNHDARALERGLAPADFRIRHDVPPQFNPAVLTISLRFHAAALNYALPSMPWQVAFPLPRAHPAVRMRKL